MTTYDVPNVGKVTVSIDTTEMFQAGYALRSLNRAWKSDGREIVGAELALVDEFLRTRGVINS